ncbi:serine phosphatase RsbU (regulator of sigma subunit)/anti-sigma regulatory factor (Ser/Thr protein kinase) [Paenibacillus phyllosphaerae]|uniref:Serine phosphatase RsbU (Regulator of sigma subunit)/anti-sigma regulatory factor (Ser/Thr protein kinase) n=1 Tax=Paenibacillus phyllosphaerae TaxID=274593 RepID=A0A7W5B4P1_9BACL|nr:ATP-binding SpoIIE family protein phosphatase [Paenibacillus phyllosphaerae]MBB3114212.1 serine phosphatase RsbU (regulator of sigma subunit)/anti-sigma regulatory factor (Ser/Thr protein kinase) [Paenibacillus phyllosphaerae]
MEVRTTLGERGIRRQPGMFPISIPAVTSKLIAVLVFSLAVGLTAFWIKNDLVQHRLITHVHSDHNVYPFLSVAGIIALLVIHMGIRLYPVYQALTSNNSSREAVKRLQKYPYELLVGMVLLGLGAVFVSEWVGREGRLEGANLISPLIGGMGISLTIAILMFTMVRRVLRPVIVELQYALDGYSIGIPIVWPMLITYACTLLAAILNLFQLTIVESQEHDKNAPYFVGMAALFDVVFALLLAGFVTLRFRRELAGLVRSIRELVVEGSDMRLSKKPAASPADEAGELALVFRELQLRIEQKFESLGRELKLANKVQQKMLPPGDLTIGSYRIAARNRPFQEVGGDLFDVLSLGPNRFAVMIGDVSGKGLPAALLMSALLLLFRSEIRRNGSPAEVLARMNRELCEAMGEDSTVTLGVGVIDAVHDTIQYASAGHLSPYIVHKEGTIEAISCSSLPIGIDEDMKYEETVLKLQPGDRFILYTDGLIESMDESGRMYSFDGLERELAAWQAGDDVAAVLDDWLARMDASYVKDNDDRTVVVLELVQAYWLQTAQREASAVTHAEALSELTPSRFYAHDWMLNSIEGMERSVSEQVGLLVATFWPEVDLREDVQSAVSEGIMNAIEHGNRHNPELVVTVQAQVGSRLTVIRIYDCGGGFFPHVARSENEMAKKRELEDPRGWGLVLIDSLSDYWSTGRDERGFYMELYFMRKSRG